MAEFPYTQVTGRLKTFFEKIQKLGKPDVVDKKWLAAIGLTSKNDHTIIPVLRFIGFIDQLNNPTGRWMNYRAKSQAGKILAEGILEGYSELFQTFPDASRRSDEELKAFFTSKTTSGDQVVSRTVTTFKTLCELADFEGVTVGNPSVQPIQFAQNELETPHKIIKEFGAGVTININIQLTLPDTTDENVYNNLFAAMKKYLMT